MAEELSPSREQELVLLARAGDERAFATLEARCEPMIRAQVAYFRFPLAETDDAAQEARLGLLSAVRSFQPSRDVSFRTYASTCVRNRLLSLLRRRAARAAEIPMENVAAEAEAKTADPAALMQEKESEAHAHLRIQEALSPREYTVLLRYLDGLSYAVIASQLQISPKAVDNALQRARAKLRCVFNIG